jgi:hypothetical protein
LIRFRSFFDNAGQATGAPGRLALEQVALPGRLGNDLATTGDPNPLTHSGVRLHLRHAEFPSGTWSRPMSNGAGAPLPSTGWIDVWSYAG